MDKAPLVFRDRVYHETHDVEIVISDDNTKHIKTVEVTLRADILSVGELDSLIKKANDMWGKGK